MDIYREEILDHYKHPRNRRAVPGVTHRSNHANRMCGDDMTVELKIADGMIVDVGFQGQGCAISIAAASLVTESLKNKPVSVIRDYTPERIASMLGTSLAPSRMKCAMLSVDVITHAVSDPAH